MPNQHSDPRETKLQYLIDALKIKTDECQIWPFGKFSDGYGSIKYKGRNKYAHRVAHQLADPHFDDSLCSLHHCDNPPCFNPRHLFQGTYLDNANDREQKGRGKVFRGEEHGCARITESQVIEIRRRYESGELVRHIAAAFKLGESQVARIGKRLAWRHIP